MIINCFYEENLNYADIVFIPESIICIEKAQEDFLHWLYDTKSKHDYWVIFNGEKRGCSYGTKAFVDWINESVCKESEEKAYLIEENATEWDEKDKSLFF